MRQSGFHFLKNDLSRPTLVLSLSLPCLLRTLLLLTVFLFFLVQKLIRKSRFKAYFLNENSGVSAPISQTFFNLVVFGFC